MRRVLFIFGTRPEAIKLAPVVRAVDEPAGGMEARVCVTAQHRHMLDQVLDVFELKPHYDLDLMTPGQSLFQVTSRIVAELEAVLEAEKPDMAVVQGDTTSTFCGALAAFYRRIPAGHVEAGLRTGDMHQPFPEEMNRVLTGRLASLHFAATEWAAENLRREGVREDAIHVTGNTGVDALLHVARRLEAGSVQGLDWTPAEAGEKLIVVTAHRRESFGAGMASICEALRVLSQREDVRIVFPVHPNPSVREAVSRLLGSAPKVKLIEPLGYVEFVDLMRRAYLLLTDSGGIQEEGPALGKPVLVMRDKTERPEAVEAGTVLLVGADTGRIVDQAGRLLDDAGLHARMSRIHSPYGDGMASRRIAKLIHSFKRE